jgi:soluble lytic murein transglycosylase
VINQFPEHAGEALLAKAQTLDRLNNAKGAHEARELLLTQFGHSESAAEYRWNLAYSKARSNDFKTALESAKAIIEQNPESQLARQAGFWAGKWAKRLGRNQEARAIFEQVLARYPQSYYAWRSAAALGLDVKDFTTVGQLSPQVVKPSERPPLPAGSDTLKELYQLGQDQEAWKLWQAEFQNRIQPTVAEQFTDGLLRMGSGDNLEGISQISKLEDRETPEEQAQYRELKQKPAYWHALYPFPFRELIENWSKQRQLNPLLVTALIRQESRFMPNIRSNANAVGLMQVMPDTATAVAKRLKLKNFALNNPDDNINLGTWILEETHQNYKNNSLLAVASYNAGSGKVATWLDERQLTDPDEFIESIPYEETRDYVKQVFGNYWNYLRLYNPQISQQVARYSINQPITLRP